ncbi:MAG: alpha/beta hydrolase [Flavipsychrobacter sp.]|nr:alpha/beta hydrolase [Flavipsychrobacter sp.]
MTIIKTDKFPQLAYRKSGQGPALVLIHGFPENGGLWGRVVPLLENDFTVIVPDLPGTGNSTLGTAGASMEDMADGIKMLLENVGLSRAVIAGHSMGGYVALAFADRYPDMLAGLALVHSTASADNDDKKETRRKSIALITKGGKEPFIKQMIPNLFAPTFREAHPSVIEEQVKRGMELEADSMVAFYEAMMNRPDRTDLLEKATFPVQFIIGKEDALVPAEVALAQSRMASRNFVSLYSNTGHMSMIEQPSSLARDLSDFVQYCYNN